MSPEQLTVRFWGVRGTLPTPGPDTVRYGGNTSCVEVELGRRSVIFDAGSGIKKLGDRLAAQGGTIETDILFSHCHMDHVCGIPFFAPFYSAQHRIRLWAGNLLPHTTLEAAIRGIMSAPLFPIEIEAFKAEVQFRDFRPGEMLDLGGGIKARTGMLNHPGGAVGYRLDCAGKSIAYITDTEHRPNELDDTVLSLVQNADLKIYDCTYTAGGAAGECRRRQEARGISPRPRPRRRIYAEGGDRGGESASRRLRGARRCGAAALTKKSPVPRGTGA